MMIAALSPQTTTLIYTAGSAATADTSTGEAVLFWCLGPVMVIAALGLLFARKAIHAALGLVLVMICLAFLYTAQQAPFLGVVQVVVYTGAVMMLFLFVLMLVGVDSSDSLIETIKAQRWIGWILGLGLAIILAGVMIQMTYGFPPAQTIQEANSPNNPAAVATVVFGNYVFAFEVVGALLITAALGALVLTHRTRVAKKVTQRMRSEARVKDGQHVTPLPAPGVYARHNAVDVPALDPYGKPIPASLSRVLRIRGQERDLADFDIAPPLGEGDRGVAVLAAVEAEPSGAPDLTGARIVDVDTIERPGGVRGTEASADAEAGGGTEPAAGADAPESEDER